MTDRLLFAILIVLAIALLGLAIRCWNDERCRRIARRARLAPGGPRIVAFYGPECHACEQQKAILDRLQARLGGGLTVEFRDACADDSLASQFGVLIVPTTVVASADGQIVRINSGLAREERLLQQLQGVA